MYWIREILTRLIIIDHQVSPDGFFRLCIRTDPHRLSIRVYPDVTRYRVQCCFRCRIDCPPGSINFGQRDWKERDYPPIDKNGGGVLYIHIYIFVESMLNGIMGGERGKYELAVENIFHKGFRLLGTLSSINREYYIPHGYEINWPVFFFFFFVGEGI